MQESDDNRECNLCDVINELRDIKQELQEIKQESKESSNKISVLTLFVLFATVSVMFYLEFLPKYGFLPTFLALIAALTVSLFSTMIISKNYRKFRS